jgi:hypothetical protein
MKLFKISQTVNTGYDTYSDAVVVAPDVYVAASIHPNSMSKYFKGWPVTQAQRDDPSFYDRGEWADTPDEIKVEYLGVASKNLSQGAVICASFHAG